MAAAIPNKTDKCKGAMLGTAIGDALGWPNEQRAKNKSKSAKINDYFIEWTRRNNKPCYYDEKILPGEYSDDTQLTLSVARSIIAGNWEKFLADKELPFWLKYERGGGGALRKAAGACAKGVLLWQSKNTQDYLNAGGNGAVMRILPHVIAHTSEPGFASLLLDVIKDTLITHGHPRAILGATCYAFALNYLLNKDSVLEYGELVSAVLEGQKDWADYLNNDVFGAWLEVANRHRDFEYASEWAQVRSSMVMQLDFIRSSLKKGLILDDASVLTQLGCYSKDNGAGDVAVLAAIYLVSRYANNPAVGIKLPAFSFGMDTDTIASITGGLLGMLCGTNWIPTEWKEVQDYDCLIHITDLLLADNSKQITKDNVSVIKAQALDWVNTPIGRMRKIDTATVQSGKYAVVTISKWQSVLGQTIYLKDMEKLDSQPMRSEEQLRISQQPALYDLAAQPKSKLITEHQLSINAKIVESAQVATTPVKTKRQLILDTDSILSLLGNTQFKNNITIGKVLKIVQALIEGENTESIAKQFEVAQVMVSLIKTYVI